jgi:hypothetical protein
MMLRWMAVLGMVMATTTTRAATAPDVLPIKDSEGTTFGVLVVCNDCQSTSGAAKKTCHGGAEEGWMDGKPCGKCMLTANFGARFSYPYDLHVTGTLVDPAGQPVKNRFVKLFLANGWTVRTKTTDQGSFRLTLGAIQARKSKEPLVTDIGTRVDSVKGNDPYYAIFLLPASYQSCPPESAQSEKKPSAKKPE